MGNYKYMDEVIGRMVKQGKPFLIIKYGITAFTGVSCNVYEVVTIVGKKLQYVPIERQVALKAIDEHNLPQLYKMDSRNIIWGDERFKEQFKERGLKI